MDEGRHLPYRLLADLVLGVHVGIVVFVVGGLAAIGFVAVQAWLGATCPLTSLEMWLRRQARANSYEGSFIEHWLQRLLYYDAPGWVFTSGYTLFGLLVVATWWWFPPAVRRPRRRPMPRLPGRRNARDGGGAA